MKKLAFAVLAIALLISAKVALASGTSTGGSSSCQPIYGGGQTCNPQVTFTITKEVQMPGKGGGNFVHDLTVNDPKFSGGQQVTFRITIQNTGSVDIHNVVVTDTLPDFLTFAGGVGNTNIGAKTFSFSIGSIAAGQQAQNTFTAKIADDSALPSNQAVTCVTNNVSATDDTGATASDHSQLCIQKNLGAVPTPQVFAPVPTKQIPATGPELFSLIGLIPTGLLGVYLKKKSE